MEMNESHNSKEDLFRDILDGQSGNATQVLQTMLDKAYDMRKFYHDQIWKMSLLFGGGAFVSFIVFIWLRSNVNFIEPPLYYFLSVCIGLISSFSWFAIMLDLSANAKRWLDWIDFLEQKLSCPMNRFVIVESGEIIQDQKGRDDSVSKVFSILSLFSLVIWLVWFLEIFIKLSKSFDMENPKTWIHEVLYAGLTVIGVAFLWIKIGFGKRIRVKGIR